MDPQRFLVLSLLLATTAIASAQPSGAQAETLFGRAKALMSSRQYAEACMAFEASQKLDPATTTLVNLADCREKNQQYATAWGLYLQAERELRAMSDDSSLDLRELVKTRAKKLESRMSRLTINVPATSRMTSLEVIRDNDRVEPGAWNQPLPVDGGTFKVSARAPDRREWTTTVVIGAEGDTQTVDVPALATAVSLATAHADDLEGAAEDGEDGEDHVAVVRETRRSLVLPIAFGAGALAFGAGALGFELSSSALYDAATRSTDRAAQKDMWESANRRRHIAQGMGVVALACAGVSIVTYLRTRPDDRQAPPASTARVSVSPVAGAGFAGLSLDGHW